MDRSSCTQKVFGGCAGEYCDRECITARIIDLDARIAATHRGIGFWELAGVCVMGALLMFGVLSAASIIVERNKDYRSAHAPV